MKHLSHPNLVINFRLGTQLALCGAITAQGTKGDGCEECQVIDAELRLSGHIPAMCWKCCGTGCETSFTSSATCCTSCRGKKWYRIKACSFVTSPGNRYA